MSTDAASALTRAATTEVQWNEETQIALLCSFINEQDLGDVLDDFLQERVQEELGEGCEEKEAGEEDEEDEDEEESSEFDAEDYISNGGRDTDFRDKD